MQGKCPICYIIILTLRKNSVFKVNYIFLFKNKKHYFSNSTAELALNVAYLSWFSLWHPILSLAPHMVPLIIAMNDP